jgi:branched-subunit amino acid ABC-type transport system permease component
MDSLISADFWQLTVNGLVRGSFYAALGAGLALVLGVTNRFHFAYTLTYTFAPYAAFLAMDRQGVSFWPAALVGLAGAVLLSVLIELLVYRPVAARAGDRSMLAVLVTSIGVSTAGIAVLQLVAGSTSLPFYGPTLEIHEWGPVQLSNFELYELATCLGLVVALAAFLAFTPLGRQVKAVRSNPGLAGLLGIGVDRVGVTVFAIAGLISGACALWYGLLYTVEPIMGDKVVIYGFVVAFLAGTRTSPLRALPVGLGVGLLEQWTSMWVSVQWTQTAVFTVLVVYLVVLSGRGRWRRAVIPRPVPHARLRKA